jgi:hypothetical protein
MGKLDNSRIRLLDLDLTWTRTLGLSRMSAKDCMYTVIISNVVGCLLEVGSLVS